MGEADTPTDNLTPNGHKIEVCAACYGARRRGISPPGVHGKLPVRDLRSELSQEERGKKMYHG